MSCALFQIVYGSDVLDIIPSENIFLRDWNPATSSWQQNAAYKGSVFGDGRRLTYRRRDNAIETFSFVIRTGDRDSAMDLFRRFQGAMELAANYWTSPSSSGPAYLAVRISGETNTRYALIVGGQFGEINNPFANPFLQPKGGAYIRFDLAIERLDWTSNAPGTTTAIELAGYAEYDDRRLGNTEFDWDVLPTSTAFEVFVNSRHVVSNLTDIYFYDDSLTAFGNSLLNEQGSYNLISSPAAGDYLAFGCDTSIANSGPFSNLVFDLEAGTHTWTAVWQYWDGSTWASLSPVVDGTDGLQNDGVNTVVFVQPSDWATTSVNGVTGYWVRFYISAVTSTIQPPSQQNRQVYSAQWGFTEILGTQVPGDIAALAKLRLIHNGFNVSVANLVIGLRSYDRGADFTAYLNAADEQNPSGVSVSATGAAVTAEPRSPTGKVVRSVNPGAYTDYVNFTLDETISPDYRGTFHLFLRGRTDDEAEAKVKVSILEATAAAEIWTSEELRFTNNSVEVLDVGIITLPSLLLAPTEGAEYVIRVEFGDDGGGATIDLVDLVFIPVDEWAVSLTSDIDRVAVATDQTVIDSAEYPRADLRAFRYGISGGSVLEILKAVSGGRAILQANARQRLWFLPYFDESATGYSAINTGLLLKLSFAIQARYLTVRGDG